MKILIIGATGAIGSELTTYLYNRIDKVKVGGYSRSYGDSFFEFWQGDYRTENRWREILKNYDVVVHALNVHSPRSAQLAGEKSIYDDVLPTVNFLSSLASFSGKHLIYLSSGGAIYGASSIPRSENDDITPIGFYGLNKASVEIYAKFMFQDSDSTLTILRPSNVYGFNNFKKTDQGVIPRIIHCINSDKTFDLWGSGYEVRDYLHISDLSEAIFKIITLKLSGTFNVSSEKGVSLKELILLIENCFNKTLKINQMDRFEETIVSIVLSSSKLKSLTNWEPLISIEEGLVNYK